MPLHVYCIDIKKSKFELYYALALAYRYKNYHIYLLLWYESVHCYRYWHRIDNDPSFQRSNKLIHYCDKHPGSHRTSDQNVVQYISNTELVDFRMSTSQQQKVLLLMLECMCKISYSKNVGWPYLYSR